MAYSIKSTITGDSKMWGYITYGYIIYKIYIVVNFFLGSANFWRFFIIFSALSAFVLTKAKIASVLIFIHAFCLSDYFTSWKLLFHATFHWLNRGLCCVWHLQHLTHVFIARLKVGHAREGRISQQHSKYTSTTQPQQLTTPAQQPHKEHTATTRQPHSCHTATTEQPHNRTFTNGRFRGEPTSFAIRTLPLQYTFITIISTSATCSN